MFLSSGFLRVSLSCRQVFACVCLSFSLRLLLCVSLVTGSAPMYPINAPKETWSTAEADKADRFAVELFDMLQVYGLVICSACALHVFCVCCACVLRVLCMCDVREVAKKCETHESAPRLTRLTTLPWSCLNCCRHVCFAYGMCA